MCLKSIPLKHHLWILFAVAAMTLPFLDKAIHVDDTAYLYSARHILIDPLRPFDFEIDWLGTTTRGIDSLVHPPLLYYYLSIPIALFGEIESALHGSLIFFPLLAGYSMYALAKRFTNRPLTATLFLLFAPPFFVTASSLMLDIPALALTLAATAFFVYGLDSERKELLIASGVLLGAAFLTKEGAALQYFLLGFYALQKKRLRSALLPLSIGCVLSGGWIVFNFLMTGELLPALTGGWFVTINIPLIQRIVTLVGYVGGSVLLLGCFLPSDRWRTGASIGLITACALFASHPGRELPGFSKVFFLLILLNGTFLLIRVAHVLRNRELVKNPDTQFLLLWFVFPVIFMLMVLSYNAMRHVLIFLPGLILLLFHADATGTRTGAPALRTKLAFGTNLAVLALLSFAISIGDYHFANTYRHYANTIIQKVRSLNADKPGSAPTLWFSGHWGFQYYMEKEGGQILGMDRLNQLRAGDWLVDMKQGHRNFLPPQLRTQLKLVEEYRVEQAWPIRVMNHSSGAGWYAEMWGPLPFALDAGADMETFSLYQLKNHK